MDRMLKAKLIILSLGVNVTDPPVVAQLAEALFY